MSNENQCKLINRIAKHLCKSKSTIMLLWTENKSPAGNIGRIETYDYEGNMVINLIDKDLLPHKGKQVIVRNCLFTRPIKGIVKNIENNVVTISDHEFILVEHEKRRFLRIFLDQPINGIVSIGMIDINIKIFDISEEGVGFFSFCDKDLLRFMGSTLKVSFVLDNKNYMNMSGRFAWISKYGYNKYMGGIQMKPSVDQRYAILSFITKYMYKVEENLLKILECV